VDLAATENPSIRAHYVAGPSRLVVHNNRMVFVAEPGLGLLLFPVVAASASQRDFFMACVERWFGISSRPDLVAVWVEPDHTAVLAVGRTSVTVSTNSDEGLVDPAGASFAAEKVFRGSLRGITLGDSALNLSDSDCFVHSGVVAVSSVYVELVGTVSEKSPTRIISIEPNVESEKFPATFEAEVIRKESSAPIEMMVEETSAPIETPVAPVAAAVPTVADIPTDPQRSATEVALPMVSDSGDADEEAWDDTVWPARRSKIETVSPAARNDVEASAPMVERPVGQLDSTIERFVEPMPLPAEKFDVGHTVIVNPANQFPEGDLTMIVDWEPPAPVFSRPNGTSGQVASNSFVSSGGVVDRIATGATTVMPDQIAPPNHIGFVQNGPHNNEPEFYDDMTIMAGDLERVRKSFVAVVTTGAAPTESSNVLGAYCSNNHFTDSTQFACVVCGADTDFSRIETGPRPSLGSLVFDDGRTVSLTTPVIVGRKPSSAVVSEHIAFENDKMLSRIHTEFRLVDWNVFVVDRQSVNGTTVENAAKPMVSLRPNVEMKLAHGAVVRFGSHSCTFRKA
jgi:FHA domain